jgi:hypothetical protein
MIGLQTFSAIVMLLLGIIMFPSQRKSGKGMASRG